MLSFMPMLRLFTRSDFDLLGSWVTSEELLFQFSANTFPFPLTYTDMAAYKITNPDRKFYIASDAEIGDYGFGEIIPQENNVPRLGRLLIGRPELRGKGLGKKLIGLLLNECRGSFGANGAELYVLTDNLPAIKCYVEIGFKYINAGIEIEFSGSIKTMEKMRLDF